MSHASPPATRDHDGPGRASRHPDYQLTARIRQGCKTRSVVADSRDDADGGGPRSILKELRPVQRREAPPGYSARRRAYSFPGRRQPRKMSISRRGLPHRRIELRYAENNEQV